MTWNNNDQISRLHFIVILIINYLFYLNRAYGTNVLRQTYNNRNQSNLQQQSYNITRPMKREVDKTFRRQKRDFKTRIFQVSIVYYVHGGRPCGATGWWWKDEVMVVRMTLNTILFHIYIAVIGLLFVRPHIEFEINRPQLCCKRRRKNRNNISSSVPIPLVVYLQIYHT